MAPAVPEPPLDGYTFPLALYAPRKSRRPVTRPSAYVFTAFALGYFVSDVPSAATSVLLFITSSKLAMLFVESLRSFPVTPSNAARFPSTADAGHTTSAVQPPPWTMTFSPISPPEVQYDSRLRSLILDMVRWLYLYGFFHDYGTYFSHARLFLVVHVSFGSSSVSQDFDVSRSCIRIVAFADFIVDIRHIKR